MRLKFWMTNRGGFLEIDRFFDTLYIDPTPKVAAQNECEIYIRDDSIWLNMFNSVRPLRQSGGVWLASHLGLSPYIETSAK